MKTLLVTGGAGFIGGNFVLRVLKKEPDTRVVNLDALTYAGNLDTLDSLRGDDRVVGAGFLEHSNLFFARGTGLAGLFQDFTSGWGPGWPAPHRGARRGIAPGPDGLRVS